MPKRPRSRHRPAARKKARRRLEIPVVAARGPDAAQTFPARPPDRAAPSPTARVAVPTTTHTRPAHADYSYVQREVRRIAILTAAMVALLIVLSIVLV